MSSAVRRLTQGALAPNPHTPVINARQVTMTTSLAFCANTGAPLIEGHRIAPAPDSQAARASVEWHFGADTGSRYCLNRAQTLKFLPLTDVKASKDLLDDAVTEPGVATVRSSHQSNYSLEQQIPAKTGSQVSPCDMKASSATEGRTFNSSTSTKDML
jgi:hypothetical protein